LLTVPSEHRRSVIRWSTALAVVGVAAVAAVCRTSTRALWREHGESGWTGRLIPLTVGGLVYASSMVMLDSARRGIRVPALAGWLLGLGHGLIGAAVGAWPSQRDSGRCLPVNSRFPRFESFVSILGGPDDPGGRRRFGGWGGLSGESAEEVTLA
jgi:hypothetical protein